MQEHNKMPGTVTTVTGQNDPHKLRIPQQGPPCKGKRDASAGFRQEIRETLAEWFRLGYEDGREGILPRIVSAAEVLRLCPAASPRMREIYRSWHGYAVETYLLGFRKGGEGAAFVGERGGKRGQNARI